MRVDGGAATEGVSGCSFGRRRLAKLCDSWVASGWSGLRKSGPDVGISLAIRVRHGAIDGTMQLASACMAWLMVIGAVSGGFLLSLLAVEGQQDLYIRSVPASGESMRECSDREFSKNDCVPNPAKLPCLS